MRLLAECSYLGAFFMGWQRQSQGERTIQGEIEAVLERMYKSPVGVTVAGRTDTLVNARQQFFHFDPPFEIPPHGLLKGMNTLLPWDIRIHRFHEVSDGFHARKKVISKTYVYRLQMGGILSPFDAWTVHIYYGKLNVARMKRAAALFAGEHDFRPFTVQPETYHSTVRRVESVEIKKKGGRLDFIVTAEGFMRYMVRRIVGTLVEVGRGAMAEEQVRALLAQDGDSPSFRSKDGDSPSFCSHPTMPPRKKGTVPFEAGAPIHASGLTLEGVVYPGLTSPYRDPIIPSGK